MFDRFIHICSCFLRTFLGSYNLNPICSRYGCILVNGIRVHRLIHLLHKGIEQHFPFFAAQNIVLILSTYYCWGLFLFCKSAFHRGLISLVRSNSSIHYSLCIRRWFHVVGILWLLLLLLMPDVGWLSSCRIVVAIVLHDNHHHAAAFPLRLRLLLLIVVIRADIYLWINLKYTNSYSATCSFYVNSKLSPLHRHPHPVKSHPVTRPHRFASWRSCCRRLHQIGCCCWLWLKQRSHWYSSIAIVGYRMNSCSRIILEMRGGGSGGTKVHGIAAVTWGSKTLASVALANYIPRCF